MSGALEACDDEFVAVLEEDRCEVLRLRERDSLWGTCAKLAAGAAAAPPTAKAARTPA